MRELSLLDTCYLAGLLLMSLVLPLLMSFCGPRDPAISKSYIKKVWIGQALLALTGLAVLVSARVAPYAAAFGFISCVGCALALRRQFRSIRGV